MNREQRNKERQVGANSMFREWVKFKILHPFSTEEYAPTPENLTRWKYHNIHAAAFKREANALPTIAVDNSLLIKIRGIYGVSSFNQMPGYTQAVYNSIAKCFPGFQVYACGSRVRGDYSDASNATDFVVMEARKAAGMRSRPTSDYDFWVEPGAIQVSDLPANCDRARLRIPEKEKVQIPICHG